MGTDSLGSQHVYQPGFAEKPGAEVYPRVSFGDAFPGTCNLHTGGAHD